MKKVIKIRKVTRELFDTFIDIFKIAYCCLKNIFLHQKLFNTNLTIVTGSDFTHFDSVINLLDSIIEHEPYTKIVLYDIGFYDSQVRFLNENYSTVEVIKFDFSKYPKFFSIRTDSDNKLGSYAWKSAIVSETLSRFGGSVLWLDAGDKITKKLTLLRIVLTSIGIYVPKSAGKISDWTHQKTIKLFNYKNLDLKKRNLASGMIGFNSSKKIATDISNEWLDSCKSEELIAPKGSDRSNHRQDQSLLTLICYKYKVVNIMPSGHKIFGIIVHQDPGKLYLSAVVDNNLKTLRDEWYRRHSDLSTNTLINADIVCLLDFTSIKDFPIRYLEKVYLIANIDSKDKSLNVEIFNKYKGYINHIYTSKEDYMKKFDSKGSIKLTIYSGEDFIDKMLNTVIKAKESF